MAIRLIEGFDHEGGTSLVNKWDSGSLLVAGQAPRIAGFSNVPQNLYRDFGGTQPTWVVGFGILTRGLGQTIDVDLSDAASIQVRLQMIDGAGGMQITIWRGGLIALLATMPGLLAVGFWYYLELKVLIDNAGTYDLHVNGASVVSGNADTQNTANAYATRVSLVGGNTNSPLWDDVYIADGTAPASTFLGDVRVETLLPNGAGASSQWTPSAGSNWQNVDETPPNGDTDYNSDGTVGDEDRYTHPALPTTVGTVLATQLTYYARKDDAGARSMSGILHSGAVDTYSPASVGLNTGYQYYTGAVRETDPDTGAAWTIAGVNATQIGVRLAV